MSRPRPAVEKKVWGLTSSFFSAVLLGFATGGRPDWCRLHHHSTMREMLNLYWSVITTIWMTLRGPQRSGRRPAVSNQRPFGLSGHALPMRAEPSLSGRCTQRIMAEIGEQSGYGIRA